MIATKYKEMLGAKSVIRELSEYATARGKEIGYENVFDYSLGNPSVPAPEKFKEAMMKFLTEYESEILLHKAAKKAFDELGVTKIPTKKSLDTKYARLLTEKKTAYGEYRQARDEMKELSVIKHNIDKLLGRQESEKGEQEKTQNHRCFYYRALDTGNVRYECSGRK